MKLSSIKKNLHRLKLQKDELKHKVVKIAQIKISSYNYYSSERVERSNKRAASLYFISKIKKKISKSILVNHCLYTKRSKVMYKRFKISRMKLKDMLQIGLIPGYQKAVW